MNVDVLIDFSVSIANDSDAARPWQEWEEDTLRKSIGFRSYEEIGQMLGRSTEAVKIRQVRRRIPAPSKRPEWYTGHQAARILCVDIHTIMRLNERGILPFQRVPGERGILQIRRVTLWRWAVNPSSWIYFKPHRVTDPRLKRLIQIRRERWNDEWWSTGRIARYYGLANSNTVTQAIYRGTLSGVKWGNWYVRKSEALARRFYSGKGGSQGKEYWSRRADEFLIRAREEMGLPFTVIGRLMKWPYQRAAYRYRKLKEDEEEG